MEVSGISGQKAAEPAAARLPVSQKHSPEGAGRIQIDESPEKKKEKVQREPEPRPVLPPPSRSGTRVRWDEESERVIFQIMGGDQQVIKQIPPEEVLRLAARMKDLQQQLFDEQV